MDYDLWGKKMKNISFVIQGNLCDKQMKNILGFTLLWKIVQGKLQEGENKDTVQDPLNLDCHCAKELIQEMNKHMCTTAYHYTITAAGILDK